MASRNCFVNINDPMLEDKIDLYVDDARDFERNHIPTQDIKSYLKRRYDEGMGLLNLVNCSKNISEADKNKIVSNLTGYVKIYDYNLQTIENSGVEKL